MTKDILLHVGFVDIGAWRLAERGLGFQLDGASAKANEVLLEQKNALYAFVHDDRVQYIGKTARTIRERLANYRTPGKTQPTNIRCNANIKKALQSNREIRILVFAPISELRYLDFEINLAAGLEDSLIKYFAPPWNGRDKGKPITEDAEHEEVEEGVTSNMSGMGGGSGAYQLDRESLASFQILLGKAYYHQGFINPGAAASKSLGGHGEPIQILFDDDTEPVFSRINRTANPSGTVRIVGRNRQIAEWFQRHFKVGELVEGYVLDRHLILLKSPSFASKSELAHNERD